MARIPPRSRLGSITLVAATAALLVHAGESHGLIREVIDHTGDGTNAFLTPGRAIASDADGNLFVAAQGTNNTFKITPAGEITLLIDSTGDGTNPLWSPSSIAVDSAGNVFVSGLGSHNAFRIAPDGTIVEIIDASGDGSNSLSFPLLTIDGDGNVFVVGKGTNNGFKIEPDGTITQFIDADGDGTNKLRTAQAVVVDDLHNIYVVGRDSHNVFRIEPRGTITEIIDANLWAQPSFRYYPEGLATDGAGNVYVTGPGGNNVLKIEPDGTITEIIDGTGDGTNVLDYPTALATDRGGNVYVTGHVSNNAFRIEPDGTITQIIDHTGDGVHPLDLPQAVTVDPFGNVFVSGRLSDNAFQIVSADPSARAQTEIATPLNSGDQLLFTYDSSGGKVPFLVVSNLAGEDVVVELAIFPDSLGVEPNPHEQRSTTEYRTVRAGGNVIFDPSGLPGGIAVVTPVRSAEDPTPVVPPSAAGLDSPPLFGGFTIADVENGSGFGQNPLGRLAVDRNGHRAEAGAIVDGTNVFYQGITPDFMVLPFFFQQSIDDHDLQLTNQLIETAFVDRYDGRDEDNQFNVEGGGQLDAWPVSAFHSRGGPNGVYGGHNQPGALFGSIERYIGDGFEGGKLIWGPRGADSSERPLNVLGLFNQAISTFSIAQRLPGSHLRWIDHGDGTATDRNTGLLWELKTAADGASSAADLHDADNLYAWCDPGGNGFSCASVHNSADGSAYTDFLAKMNGELPVDGASTQECFSERCDWRIPTADELAGILEPNLCDDEGRPCTAIPGATVSSGASYWSSTSSEDPTAADAVSFGSAETASVRKTGPGYVRAVRGPIGGLVSPLKIATPARGGDQLIFPFDSTSGNTAFVVVANLANELVTVQFTRYDQGGTPIPPSFYQDLGPNRHEIYPPELWPGAAVDAGIVVATPVRSRADPTPIVAPSPPGRGGGPLFGGFTQANLETGAAFGQNPLARLAVNAVGQRAVPGSVVDGADVRYQQIAPDTLILPFFFNPSDPQLTNRVILGAFRDVYLGNSFEIGPAEVSFPLTVLDAEGRVVGTSAGPTVRGLHFDTIESLAAPATLESSGKMIFTDLTPADTRTNVFGLMSQALSTFSVGQRMPGAFLAAQ